MFAEQEDVYYYITVMNENYVHPAMPEGARERHPARHVLAARWRAGDDRSARACSCWARGSILREVLAAADLLRDDFGVNADVWSATSFTELRRDGMDVDRWNMLHPAGAAAALVRRDVA